jgi:anti-anti-sigma factor
MFHQVDQGAVRVIAGVGPLNHESAAEARALLQPCLIAGQPLAVFDLEHISLMDSVGLEMLVQTHEEFARRGGAFKLAAPNPLCRDILHLTQLDKRLEIFATSRAAVGSFLK